MPDNILVNRNGQTYQVDLENTAMIEDTDLLLVNRDGATYTVPGSQISRGDFSEVIISPTSITPETSEQVITATADIPKVGSIVPADVVWTWYLYDEATGDAGKTEVQSTTNREITDTYILPASAAGKFIGCSVEYLAVTIDETERCAVGTPAGPVADMNGLRFDRDRTTRFTRSTVGTIGTTFTFSTWVKPTTIREPNRLFTIYNIGGSTYSMARIRPDLRIQCYLNTDGSSQPDTTATLDANSWNHLVITVDAGKWTVVINGGTPQVMGTSTNANNPGATFGVGGFEQSGNGNECIDGYLSDYYFVDGLALEPTVFAKEFPEGWGPLDGSEVKTNIANGKVQPYDTRPNMDQAWSTFCSGDVVNSNQPYTSAFDGNTSNQAQTTAAGGVINWTIPSGLSGKLEICFGSNNPQKAILDSVTIVDDAVTNASTFYTITEDITPYIGTVLSVTEGTNANAAGTLAAVRVDGRILVEGPVLEDQNWSETGVTSNGNPSKKDMAKAFDADSTTNYPLTANGATFPCSTTWTFDTPLSSATTFQIMAGSNFRNEDRFNTAYTIIQDNGSEVNVSYEASGMVSNSGAVPNNVVAINGIRGFRINYQTPDPNQGVGNLFWVKVDGKYLKDLTPQWDTSQVWSNGVSGLSSGSATGIFDGVIPSTYDGTHSGGTTVNSGDTTDTMTINFPVQLSGEVTIFPYYSSTVANCSVQFDSDTAIPMTGAVLDYSPVSLGNQTFTSITFEQQFISGGGSSFAIAGIRVGDTFLVDSGSYGTDGFYLPFDPTAGANYSNTGTGDYYPNEGFERAFDGNLTTFCAPNHGGGTVSFTFNNIPVQTLRVHYFRESAGALLKINNVDVSSQVPIFGNGGSLQWTTITGVTTLSSIEQINDGGVGNVGIAAIEVNGVILIDHSAIGADASGRNNHFEDSGFSTLPLKIIPSDNWTAKVSGPNRSGFEPSNAFNGITTGTGWVPAVSSAQTFTPNGGTGIPFTTLAVYGYVDTGANNVLSVNGVDVTDKLREGPSAGTIRRAVLSDVPGVTSPLVSIVSTSQGSASNALISAIEIDDAILVDNQPSISPGLDTVLDTPMFNYALLKNGSTATLSSGNLKATTSAGVWHPAHSTIDVTSGKYYFEVIRSGSLAGCVVGAMNPSTSSTYSGSVYSLFDGNTLLTNSDGSGPVSQGFVETTPNGEVVGVGFDKDAETIDFFNDFGFLTTLSTQSWATSLSVALNGTGSVFVNYGQQPFVKATDNGNGTVTLIDTSPNRSRKWSDSITDGNGVTNSANSFNGNTGDFPMLQNDATERVATYDFTQAGGAISTNSIEVYNPEGPSSTTEISINGAAFAAYPVVASPGNYTFDVPGGQLNTIAIKNVAGANTGVSLPSAFAIDGRILADGPADTSQRWSNGTVTIIAQNGRFADIKYLFDGDLTTNSSPRGNTVNSIVRLTLPQAIPVTTSVEIYSPTDAFQGRGASINGGANVPFDTNGWNTIHTGPATLASLDFNTGGGNSDMAANAVRVDGLILVDGGGNYGPYNKLYQTWSQWVVQTLRLGLAEADALKVMLLEHAQTYQAGEDYCEGSVIKAFGELWIAVNNSPATTFADLPAIRTHPNWERLNISVN